MVVPKAVDVCIIGGGPSGLAAANALLRLDSMKSIVVLEAHNTVGGVWRGDGTGKAWPGMCTNLSKEKCMFADLDHAEDVGDFPSGEQMAQYFERYSEVRGITPHLHLNTKVLSVTRNGGEERLQYAIKYHNVNSDGSQEGILHAKQVIVATGVFAKGVVPDDMKAVCEAEHIKWVHSEGLQVRDYTPADHVLFVGAAYSGADMAVATANTGAEVTVLVRQPRYYCPRRLKTPDGREESWDRLWEPRQIRHDTSTYNTNATQALKHEFLSKTLPRDAGNVDPLLAMDSSMNTAQMVIADNFLESIEAGKIDVVKSTHFAALLRRNLENSDASDLTPAKQEKLKSKKPITHVVFATGYRCNLEFLSDDILAPCDPDFSSDFLPLLLGKSTIHPAFDDMGFVGLYRGPYITSLEVQATWLAHLFCGKTERPNEERLKVMLEEERFLREYRACMPQEIDDLRKKRDADSGDGPKNNNKWFFPNAFPHPDFVSFTDSIAEEYGCRPTTTLRPDLVGTNVTARHYRPL